ncbi:DsbA family oxidoreductase [Brevibacterium jeotgali]|uniref:Predicted dithiol-disulfide isomerase, DsbA family n=1 Tax=Brevibacterium jeotgali TaxID=1262550 RepID=A0A2H1L3U1_9MICO|nr:DsbA family protein [Brevibacterium jeotgali]TWC03050.1 putative DsbA family dithiol-disulfide isomerase [Brevibacterium jeotgali]SMY11073.1 Predicted dithiol-disulfide isomerase, DsbA family [Brevibacterium jeotgali]
MVVEAAGTDGAVQQSGGRRVRIDVWTDLVCPWCYVGQGRLERAIADEGVDVDLVVHSFELDPSAPHARGDSSAPDGAVPSVGAVPSNIDYLITAKGMPREQVVAMEERVGGLAAELDMPYAQERPMANTRTLHRVVQTVAATVDEATAAVLFSQLQGGYFAGTFDPFDTDSLVQRAVEAGAPEEAVRRAAAGESAEADDAVEADIARARSLGAQGVPFMVFDDRVAAPGAMDVATYRRALRQLADGEEVA